MKLWQHIKGKEGKVRRNKSYRFVFTQCEMTFIKTIPLVLFFNISNNNFAFIILTVSTLFVHIAFFSATGPGNGRKAIKNGNTYASLL
jgi:hypothetical protein